MDLQRLSNLHFVAADFVSIPFSLAGANPEDGGTALAMESIDLMIKRAHSGE
jgi:hypothetical protein